MEMTGDLAKVQAMKDTNWKPAVQYWREKAEQYHGEKIQAELQAMNSDFIVVLETARAELAEAEVARLTAERDALQARAEKAEVDRLAMAQKFDEHHPDPALMAKIIMKNIENGLRVEDLEAERDALRAAARQLLDMIEAQQRHITPAPRRESRDDENSRDERDQVFADAVIRLEAALNNVTSGEKTAV